MNFTIGRFHIGTGRRHRNKTHLIFARSFRRCCGVYWCRVPLAWGLLKYQSPHTRLQIIYVYIARAYPTRHLHDGETRRQRPDASFFFARKHHLNIFNPSFSGPYNIILPTDCSNSVAPRHDIFRYLNYLHMASFRNVICTRWMITLNYDLKFLFSDL